MLAMLKSEKRILTTHAGSLPRNPKLTDLLLRQGRGEGLSRSARAQTAPPSTLPSRHRIPAHHTHGGMVRPGRFAKFLSAS
jgi:hypothetical protein